MDIQRLILFMVFSMSLLFLWEAWQKEQRPPVAVVSTTATATAGDATAGQGSAGIPTPGQVLTAAQAPGVPVGVPVVSSNASTVPAVARDSANRADRIGSDDISGEKITIKTDLLLAEIDTAGGDLRHLALLAHPDREDKNKPFTLLQSDPNRKHIVQTGLIGEGLPNHNARFKADPQVIGKVQELQAGSDKIEIRLTATDTAGVKVAKVYTFHRGSYLIDVSFEVTNLATKQNGAAIQPFSYFQMLRDGQAPVGAMFMIPTYTGAAVFTEQDKYQKIEFSALEKGKATYPKNSDNGWIAMVQQYFIAAWLPQDKTPREYYAKQVSKDLYSVGVIAPLGTPGNGIAPGATARITMPLYTGPQDQAKLAALAPGLDLTVDYGWLTVIGAPLFWLLSWFHALVGNWGVSIILLTVVIKLMFFPLSAASYRSMANMRKVTPKLTRLREQFGDDRQKMHTAMMELYKTEKINPMGGCLPIVVQIPVFISLYWVLLASVELRYAPFMLWIQDLSSPDPYYVLPVIMGLTMIIQTRLNPTPPDPIQAKVMQIMPIAFSIFFFFFPAGLVLYWLVNNILSIAQQWHITRGVEAATAVAVAATHKKR